MMKKITLFAVITSLLFTSAVSFAQSGIISTVAGNGSWGYFGDGGLAVNAKLDFPSGVATDTAGNLYIADNYNARIRKVSRSGIITTVAGDGGWGSYGDGGPATSAAIGGSFGLNAIATDHFGNIYLSNRDSVRKINASGIINTIAGGGTSTADGVPAITAGISVRSIAVDNMGNIFLAMYNNTIRMINTSGIISTIAGTGVVGFSGDGGPATLAQFRSPTGIAVDNTGNIYIADSGNGRIRMINSLGYINTIAGNGVAGSTGDCGPATLASLKGPGSVCVDARQNVYIQERGKVRMVTALSGLIRTVAGTGVYGFNGDNGPAPLAQLSDSSVAFGLSIVDSNLYILDAWNERIRKVTLANEGVEDSFFVNESNLCSGVIFEFYTNSYSASQTIESNYGDGTIVSAPVLNGGFGYGILSATHTYTASGTYVIKNVLLDGPLRVDSFSYTHEYSLCNVLPVKFYYDELGSCVYTPGSDSFIVMTNPMTIEVDSNSISIDTLSATGGLYYTAFGSANDIYSFRLLSSSFPTTCPVSEIIADTLQSGIDTNRTKYFGLACGTTLNFDLAINPIVEGTGVHWQGGNIYVCNYDCSPAASTVTLHFSPKFVLWSSVPSPSSYSGNTVTWDFPFLSTSNPFPIHIQYALSYNPVTGFLAYGDTVQSYYTITPIVGDDNPANNEMIIIDTVKAGYDPNEMWVLPQGYIPADTTLQYTINFENTGNDTAFNIYVMDTLSDNVDISTLRLTSTSNVMNITKVYDNIYHNILRFDFPNINLLDSSHHGLCDGYVAFNIKTKPGLANGTTIFNQAGIFFDANPVVMTNTVEDIIGPPPVSLATKNNVATSLPVSIYPNPTTGELTIKTDKNTYTSLAITNTMGQLIMQQQIVGTQTNVNVSALTPGMYYIILKGAQGSTVQKFVKL